MDLLKTKPNKTKQNWRMGGVVVCCDEKFILPPLLLSPLLSKTVCRAFSLASLLEVVKC